MHYSLDSADENNGGSNTAVITSNTATAGSTITDSADSVATVHEAVAVFDAAAPTASYDAANTEHKQLRMSDVDVVERFKQDGNAAFAAKDYSKALQLWGAALVSFDMASVSTKVSCFIQLQL
jgi:hypothetical protein